MSSLDLYYVILFETFSVCLLWYDIVSITFRNLTMTLTFFVICIAIIKIYGCIQT